METLVLVVEAEGWDLPTLARCLDAAQIAQSPAGACLDIVQDEAHAYACVMQPDEDGLFEDWPDALVPDGPFTAFSIDYRRPGLAEAIVRAVAQQVRAVVDTNFGDVLPAGDFLARLARDGEGGSRWEWWRWDDEGSDA